MPVPTWKLYGLKTTPHLLQREKRSSSASAQIATHGRESSCLTAGFPSCHAINPNQPNIQAGWKDIDYMMVNDGHSYLSMSKKITNQKFFFSVFLYSSSVFHLLDLGTYGTVAVSPSSNEVLNPNPEHGDLFKQSVHLPKWPFYRHEVMRWSWGLECHDFSHLRNHLLISETVVPFNICLRFPDSKNHALEN